MQGSFDGVYQKHDSYWGLKPSKLVLNIPNYRKSGSVLDVGAGEGRNALYLASKGFDVTAMDISTVGISKIEQLAKEHGLTLKSQVKDISRARLSDTFDIIISLGALMFLEDESIAPVIHKLQKHTASGGLNVITVMTKKNPNKNFPHLFNVNELRNYYSDWELIKYREFMTPEERHGDGVLHRHGIAVLLAQKPQ
ncbi:methyltransferase domain-containing protein [Candidatus Woesearchaeota archaeon]|nr:methyltransferase domain-containing protein [Candidatus Woesearchaeota archaeon]MBT4248064.1 methyltransferase domain-containing protein [Candidatus Woesearchaeota archaeon]